MSEKNDACCADERKDDTCCAEGQRAKLIVYSCSGNANVGQIANKIMIQLDKNGYAKAVCLSGLGAGLSGFVKTAKAGRSIVLDGCPTACGRKIFEIRGIEPYKHFVVTDFGIKKTYDLDQLEQDTKVAMDGVVPNI
jgi:uncharacterized metal-binding protein